MDVRHILFLGLLVGCCYAAGGSGWNYVRSDESKGPSAWGTVNAACDGNNNSPIDIVSKDVVKVETVDWDFSMWDVTRNWTVSDIQSTVKFSVDDVAAIKTKGGKLPNDYKLAQFHFHWGDDNTLGSEHTVDGKSYPLEVHFVHFKATFDAIGDAVGSPQVDSLAALGVFFEIGDEDNAQFQSIVDAISNLNGTEASRVEMKVWDTVKPAFEGDYYRYNGGLTTPGCNEQVKWTVFKTPVKISQEQMDAFRDLDKDAYGAEKYRPVQDIGDRQVKHYTKDPIVADDDDDSGAAFGRLDIVFLASLISATLFV